MCRKVSIIPLEVIVRNIAAGSMAKRLGIPEGTRIENTIYELCYKSDELGHPLINDHHAVFLGAASYQELELIYELTTRINRSSPSFLLQWEWTLSISSWSSAGQLTEASSLPMRSLLTPAGFGTLKPELNWTRTASAGISAGSKKRMRKF